MTGIPRQFFPLVVLFILLITAFFVFRHLLIPKGFGDYGHYRSDAADDVSAQDIVYAGISVCIECHDDINDMKKASFHRGISCEVCHGAAAAHANEPDEFTPAVPRGREQCLLCHNYIPARPSGFPQIISEQHNPGKSCMTCHDPHNPSPPHTPKECSACHREIASELTLSHHTTLSCTQCHMVPKEHKNNPRLVTAEKPKSKQICGQCHAIDADSEQRIPRIDIDTHGERYICWDCHYPHFPEAH